MSSSKSSKRTVSVEKSSQDSSSVKSKPSVFERLGAPHSYGSSERQDLCLDFVNNGTCSYGSKCKYAHVKRDRERDRGSEQAERDREKDRASDDLRSRVPRKRDENESEQDTKKSGSQRKEKDGKMKSAVVVTKSSENIDDIWPESFGDADKGSAEREAKGTRHQGGSSSAHGIESEGHKWSSKSMSRLSDSKIEEGIGQSSASCRSKNKSPRSPSHGDNDSSRRLSKDKKKKKRHRSQETPSPDKVDDKLDQKHQKDSFASSKFSSHKHSKSSSDLRVKESSGGSMGLGFDKKSKPQDVIKDDNTKSVEKRLLMIAMESDSKQDSGRISRTKSPIRGKRDASPTPKGKDSHKDYSSPSSRSKDVRKERVESPSSKNRKMVREQSVSPVQLKDRDRRERSPSPPWTKDRSSKSSHTRSQNLTGSTVDRPVEKPKPLLDVKLFETSQKHDVRPQKSDKEKAGRRRRRSSSSSASSSSSSSSGSDSGSSSGTSSSGSSSSSSSSSDVSSDERKPGKDRQKKDVKVVGKKFDVKSGHPKYEKEAGKESGKRKKEKEQLLQEASRGKRPVDDKSKGFDMMMGKDDHIRSDASPERSRKKDFDKSGQSVGLDSKKLQSSSLDQDRSKRDSQHGSRTSDSLRQKHSDAVEYSRKGRSPLMKDDRGKPLTPVDVSRHGLSPIESQRGHSTKPVHSIPDQECDHEGQSSSQFRDYYSNRDKASRKEDDHFQRHPEEFYPKKHQDRLEPRGQGYSSHKHQSVDPYDRSREGADHDREERDGRYPHDQDHGYESGRYPVPLDRHHSDITEESRSRQDYYASSYRDERRSGRTDESLRRDLERTEKHEKHSSGYDLRESDRDFDARDHQKSREQRPSEYREKTRGDPGEYGIVGGVYKKAEESRRERTTQWVSERDPEDQSRQGSSRSDQRGFVEKRDGSRKRTLEDDGGTGHSPIAKKMREGSPSESHHSFSSRATYERDYDRLDKDRGRSYRGRNLVREEDRYSSHTEGDYRGKGRDRGIEKEWDAGRRSDTKDTKEKSKDPKGLVESRERGLESKESWHREESSKRHRSPGDKLGIEGWEKSKDWKRSRTDLDAVERDKTTDRSSRRDEDHRGSPSRDRSPKASGYTHKPERTDGERVKRSSDSLAFAKSIEADIEIRGRLRSEEKRSVLTKDVEPSVIPVHVEDRMRRSQSRGSLGSKHSQRDRESRRDDRIFDDRYDAGRDGHYRDDRLPAPERSHDHEDREAWVKDRSYDRVRPEDDGARSYRLPFDHDRTERDLSKSRDFEGDWEMDSFRRENLGYRGLTRPPNWERERPREEWESRYDHAPEVDYRGRRDVLLPPPPRPRPVPAEARAPSPLPAPVEAMVPPPPLPPPAEHLPARSETKPEHTTPSSKTPRQPKNEDTGYDDISDGELDDLIGIAEDDKEDSQIRKPGVIDILDIKWESLIQNKVERSDVPHSVMNRFTVAAIFRRIGVSRAFAGDDLLNQVKNFCQKQLDAETAVEAEEQKKEPEEQPSDLKVKEESEKPVVKEEVNDGIGVAPDPEKGTETPCGDKPETVGKTEAAAKFELLDDLADFHAGLQLKSSERVGVVNSIGPYRRALCARRDLAIRRGLCKVDKEDILMFPTHVVDQDLYKQSLQLFHQDRTLEKKLPLSSSVHRLQAMPAASA